MQDDQVRNDAQADVNTNATPGNNPLNDAGQDANQTAANNGQASIDDANRQAVTNADNVQAPTPQAQDIEQQTVPATTPAPGDQVSPTNTGSSQQGVASENVQPPTFDDNAQADNTQKDPSEWKTGDEPMTGAQESYVNTLADQAGENVPDDMSKAEASEKIDELQDETGRSGGSQQQV